MRLIVVLVALLAISSALALSPPLNNSWNSSQYAPQPRHYSVNISVSKAHQPTYGGWYNRAANITLNVKNMSTASKAPTPNLVKPLEVTFDVARNNNDITLDPRTCANNLAYCYLVLDHPQNLTPAANYSGFSKFKLPPSRIKTYVCIGNDTACVNSATNCYCPTKTVPPPPQVKGQSGRCSGLSHLCLTDFDTFVLCKGNLTKCQEQYAQCGCGTQAACVSKRNTCVNTRDELVMCKGALSDCIGQFGTCFCGPDMMSFQVGCTTATHRCTQGRELILCPGSLADCALRYDKCEC